MPFCSAGNSSYTDTELQAIYISQNSANPAIISVLESSPRTRNEDGFLTATSVSELVTRMISLNIIPMPPVSTRPGIAVSDAEKTAYQTKDSAFKRDSKSEFCFYFQRYNYIQNKFISLLSSTTPQTAEFNRYLTMATTIKRRLYDITYIIEGVKNRRDDATDTINAMLTEMKNELNITSSPSNVNIGSTGSSTGTSSSSSSSSSTSSSITTTTASEDVENIRREMMKYSKEKVRATDNLLSLYGFMNILAIGMLVYVYRSMEE